MPEISVGLQTMWSFPLDLSSEQLWPSCPDTDTHRPLTHLYLLSSCEKHVIQITGLRLTSVSPSYMVSCALLFQTALKKTKCVVFRDVGEDQHHNVEMFVTCFLKKTLCFAQSSSEGWALRRRFHACSLQNTQLCKASSVSNHLLPFYLYSSLTIEYEEDYEDVTVNQMLVSKSQETDATEILNNLLKEYDKKLRPDIGGNWLFLCQSLSWDWKRTCFT